MSVIQTIIVFFSVLFAPAQMPVVERPVVNIPRADRQENWDSGSCVHATMVSLFRWQGRYKLANYWRRNYSGGEWVEDMAAKLDKAGVRYAYTSGKRDVGFLEWACQTRRGCGVAIHNGAHMVALVHISQEWVGLLDNNDVSRIKWIPRQTFLSDWIASGSWAVTVVYTPAAPLPGVGP
jgi:hypothetical protein